MNRYTVVWSDAAQDQLAQFWIDAVNRTAITQAAHSIDRELSSDPESKGQSVSEDLRSFDAPPLRALFTVAEQSQSVQVIMVRLFVPPATSNGK